MPPKKVIIIGAGLSGLSAASYLQMNGFNTEIFEMHSSPGGLCTSWKRKDYMIDGCIHFMIGSTESESTYPFWNGLIDMKKLDFVYSDQHCSVINGDNTINFYSDVDKLEQELLQKAPEDKKQIQWLIKGIRKFLKIKFPVEKPVEVMNLMDKLKAGIMILPFSIKMINALKISNKQFAGKLKNPYLRKAFKMIFVGELHLFSTMLIFVWRHNRQMGYPIGGAVKISTLMESNYLKLGGKITYNAKVSEIITENNRAKGIVLEDGQIHAADIVVSAADGRSTVYDLLHGKFRDKHIIERYEGSLFETIDKTLYVSIGVNKDFSKEDHKIYFFLKKPIRIDPKTILDYLDLTHYCYDPTAAPQGKTLFTLMPEALDWEYWKALRDNDIAEYNKQKERIASSIIEALDEHYGDIKKNVEMFDVATPATYIRYTGNWTGGQISWKAKKEITGKSSTWKIKGLENFYMTGQWTGVSGGLNHVVMMGNHVAQIICKDEKMTFSFNQK